MAICLSGGGFRATLFHLGALRRLNELGVLAGVQTITSVSGGSIMSAYLIQRLRPWPAAGAPMPNWEVRMAAPVRAFTGRNLRTGPLARRLLPWNWLKPGVAVEALAARYSRALPGLHVADLPASPHFVFCSTDMAFGVNWVISRDRMGDYQAGYATPPPNWPLGRVVAASSCFPPAFDPLPAQVPPDVLSGGKVLPSADRDGLIRTLGLTDGGVYDNMGLEPVWKDHQVVLVSDGGATFNFSPSTNPLTQLPRYPSIMENQARALRKRWLIANFLKGELDGTYWGIGSHVEDYLSGAAGYSRALVDQVVSQVRTDLDAFSEAERAVLENHGYLLADVALQRHLPRLLPLPAPPLAIPHPAWMDEATVRRALADSHRRCLLGRF
jgi:NTE family protein